MDPLQIKFFPLVTCFSGSSTSFHDSIAHFFLVLNNISLSGCTPVYLSIHLLKDLLVASKFWQFINKAAVNICVQAFCADISFQIIWVNIKGHDGQIVRQEYVQFCQKPPRSFSVAGPPARPESSCCVAYSPASGVVSVPGFGHSCVWWCFPLALVYISLITDDVEYLSICLLAIHRPSLVRCLLKVLGLS